MWNIYTYILQSILIKDKTPIRKTGKKKTTVTHSPPRQFVPCGLTFQDRKLQSYHERNIR